MELGVIYYGGRGAVVIGAITSENTGRVQSSLYPLMLDFDNQAVLTDNISGYLWSKLIYGAMLCFMLRR